VADVERVAARAHAELSQRLGRPCRRSRSSCATLDDFRLAHRPWWVMHGAATIDLAPLRCHAGRRGGARGSDGRGGTVRVGQPDEPPVGPGQCGPLFRVLPPQPRPRQRACAVRRTRGHARHFRRRATEAELRAEACFARRTRRRTTGDQCADSQATCWSRAASSGDSGSTAQRVRSTRSVTPNTDAR
jgi:hypothetical protein